MGFINNLAGAGGLIGLAALDLAVGLDASAANATLRPAAVAVTAAGMLGFLSKGQRIPGRAWLYGLAAAPGAIAGSLLAIALPSWVYQAALIVVVTTLFAQQLRPTRQAPAPTDTDVAIGPRRPWTEFGMFTLVGLHMGFLQIAVGLLTILVLARVGSRNLVEINAAKMAVLGVTSCTSVISLQFAGAIHWGPAGWLAAGAAIGSFVAGRWSVRRGHAAIRGVVLIVCALVLVRLLFQAAVG